MTLHDVLRDRLCLRAGLTRPEVRTEDRLPPLAVLQQTEWSPEFEQLMRNRLAVGPFRYGRLGIPGKPQWDRTSDIAARIAAYVSDGNAEHLVDVANLCLLEFVEGYHPKKHFSSSDDTGLHTKQVNHV